MPEIYIYMKYTENIQCIYYHDAYNIYITCI